MKCFFIILLCFAVDACAGTLRGLSALEQIEALPLIRRGVAAHQVSSFERNGGNDDRNCWLYQDEVGDYVVFDEKGPGCIYRLWMTHGGRHPEYSANYTTNHIKFYLDDDTAPRFECSIADLFSGTNAPFLTPLAGGKSVSSGGLYSYVPIPYEQRCRIVLTDIPPESMRSQPWGTNTYWMYYNITFHDYSSTNDVTSWTAEEDLSTLHSMMSNVGTDPKATGRDLQISNSLVLSAATATNIVDYEGSGVINSINLDSPGLTDDQLTNLWLNIYWDGAEDAAVSAPVGEFFGVGKFAGAEVRSLMIGRTASSGFYCYFPMPFWNAVRIEIENRGEELDLEYSVKVGAQIHDPARSGYFYAKHASQSYTNRVVEPDFLLLEEEGRGHLVGASLYGTGGGKIYGNGLAYLEGDERIYIDGNLTPQLHGTGNEDYFNGGWYYNRGAFSLPYHGSPVRSNPYSMGVETNYVGAYRLHIGDVIPFHESIRFGMEHGGANEAGCTFSSVSCYYKLPGTESGLIPCAEIDVSDPVSEEAGGYSEEGSQTVSNSFCYSGNNDQEWIADTGSSVSNRIRISVSIPPQNDGLLLRRRTDAGVGFQSALVSVDGVHTGEWMFHDEGFAGVDQRWLNSEFYIPYGFTAGKTNVVLLLEVASEGDNWTAYRYSIRAVRPLIADGDIDSDGMGDVWEVANFGDVAAAEGSQDSDEDGFPDLQEYICLTDPHDDQSVFHLERTGSEVESRFSFHSQMSRFYHVMQSTNLMLNNWVEVVGFAGDGQEFEIPVSTNAADVSQEFFRVRVEIK